MHRIAAFASLLVLAVAVLPVAAQERPVAFVGGRILSVSTAAIDDGVLLVAGGRIQAVGPAATTPLPRDVERIDVRGRVIMPGLVDTHSHVGGGWGGDGSGPIQPDVRVLDSINVRDAGFRKCLAGGLTTLNVMPGSGHLLSGQTVYVKLRPSPATIDDILYRTDDGAPLGGMKMANGTNSQKDPPFPGTRSKSASLVRQTFLKAQEYARKIEEAGDDPEKRPDRDLELEGIAEVLAGRRIVHHHAHRADDIMTVLRLRDEFHFKVVLHHASEAWKVADQLAAAGAACSVILVDSPGGKIEAMDMSLATGAVLERAGVACAFHTDDPITDSRLFLRTAALGVRAGMSPEGALRALTVAGAEMLGLEQRIGTLEPGKDADFVILSGDPFALRTKVLQTWVEGRKAFDRDDPEDRLFAVGGYGASRDQSSQGCCTQVRYTEGR